MTIGRFTLLKEIPEEFKNIILSFGSHPGAIVGSILISTTDYVLTEFLRIAVSSF
jgi:hypothetical protein